MMLANQLFVSAGHTAAEQTRWAFRVGHPATIGGAQRIYDGTHIEAIGHGVAMFEAMVVAVVGLHHALEDMFTTNAAAAALLRGGKRDAELQEHMVEAVEQFGSDLPNAREVIVAASERFYGPLTVYALLGAAIERQIVLGVRPRPFNKPMNTQNTSDLPLPV